MDEAGADRASRRGAREDVLVEREREVALLDRLIDEAAGGTGHVLLIEGEAGIGKSRLLAETGRLGAARGFRVLSARGSELELEFAFGVVRRLLEPVVADPELGPPWLAAAAGAAAAIFAPPASGDASPGDHSFATLDGLYRLTVTAAAGGPLLLQVDDVHWCDRPSLRFLAYLVQRIDGLPLLLAAGMRVADPHADAALLGELVRHPAATVIEPAPLSETGSGRLLRARLGADPDRAFAAATHRATGGNPLLLRELLRALEAERVRPDATHVHAIRDIGPRALSRTVLLRLSRLPADAIAVARATAVLGEDAGVTLVSRLAELPDARVAEMSRALVRAEILRPEPPHGYIHPLVRDVVYRELAPAERELQHQRAARLLSDVGASAEQIASHLLRVPSHAEPWVVAVLREAGRAAVLKGAAESAVAYLRRALAEPPPPEERSRLLLALGTAEALVNAPAAAEHLEAALQAPLDPGERGRATHVLGRMLLFTRPPQEAVAALRRTAAELPPELLDLRRTLEAMELYAVAFGASGGTGADRLVGARRGVAGDGAGARMLEAVAAWDWALSGGAAGECTALASAALAGGVLVASDPGFMAIVAIAVLVLADRNEALAAWPSALAEAHRRGSLDAVSGVHLWSGWTWLQRGELDEAESSLAQAIEDTTRWNSATGAAMSYAQGFIARVFVERGELDRARAALARRGTPYPTSDGDGLCRRAEVELLLAEGRAREAAGAALEYAARVRGAVNPGWAPWRSLQAQALERLGRRAEALPLLEEELGFARRWGAPGTLGHTLTVLGAMTGADGIELLREAVAVTAASPAVLVHARALAALGTSLRHARRPADAREPLREAFELATRCGARPLAQRARAELLAAGGRPQARPLLGPRALTPSERRVVDLAVEGHSNRDIAQVLFVTPKTVEVHLSSAYRKLGISSRARLAAALEAGAGL